MVKPNDIDYYLNTNEMMNDYAFYYQIVIYEQPLDFEAVGINYFND